MNFAIPFILVAITILFCVLLVLRFLLPWRYCVLCGSVSLTWVALLVLNLFGFFPNTTIIAMLMGASITGIYYLLKQKTPERLHIFTLPFFLTMTAAAWSVLRVPQKTWLSLMILGVLWGAAFILYALRNTALRSAFETVVRCCKSW